MDDALDPGCLRLDLQTAPSGTEYSDAVFTSIGSSNIQRIITETISKLRAKHKYKSTMAVNVIRMIIMDRGDYEYDYDLDYVQKEDEEGDGWAECQSKWNMKRGRDANIHTHTHASGATVALDTCTITIYSDCDYRVTGGEGGCRDASMHTHLASRISLSLHSTQHYVMLCPRLCSIYSVIPHTAYCTDIPAPSTALGLAQTLPDTNTPENAKQKPPD
ncbi:hypothetical protein KQX54_021799 [Cotesia glomerata]|uniref:Uncharacterized protein n=1 Tax=Cotesia glomerata TaxID=32391 RepID=A0AAV7JAA1_COTGL|nr:hypothetical protein KQX54_021799 [Cotesia glomerata]